MPKVEIESGPLSVDKRGEKLAASDCAQDPASSVGNLQETHDSISFHAAQAIDDI